MAIPSAVHCLLTTETLNLNNKVQVPFISPIFSATKQILKETNKQLCNEQIPKKIKNKPGKFDAKTCRFHNEDQFPEKSKLKLRRDEMSLQESRS